MQQEHGSVHLCTFTSGANYDGNLELFFSKQATGTYIISRNARPTSNTGDIGAIEKIKGEIQLYNNSLSLVGYTCICSEQVNQFTFEIWASVNPLFPTIVRVNGQVVASSIDFQFTPNRPLQWHKNQSTSFSEISVTDRIFQPPFIFHIEDMVDSVISEPDKYFSNFDPILYQVNLQTPLDMPVFIELVNVGGGGGKPVGQYQYQIRYSSEDGDRTKWSQATPMIPIMQSLSTESDMYPWAKTYGGPPNPSSVTSFAPKLRFRVTNLYNYDFIEIRCIPYNAGAGIEFTPLGSIVAKIQIEPGEISVREYIDPSESNVNLPITASADTLELAQVETAGSVRYFDRRLVLFNVKLASKESNLTFLEINGREGFPVIDKLFKSGYKDPYNVVYKKSEMRGEKRGFGAVCYDGVGTPGFVTKIPTLKNFQFPDRRDVTLTETQNYSYNGTVRAANTAVTSVSETHEVFDMSNPRFKSDICSFKNIIQKGRVLGLTGTKSTIEVKQDCDETNQEIENHAADVNASLLVSTAYLPYTPTGQNDSDVGGHNYIVNTRVATNNPGLNHISDGDSDVENYRPVGMSIDYYAMGMMISGVDNFPNWAKAFSIVATENAKRVLCQGIGYYSLTPAKFKIIGSGTLGGKETKKFWFYAPDIANGIVSSESVNDIIDNPQNYKLQFVSPLGFFSEWYAAEDNFIASKRDRCIDMISYVRMLRDRTDPSDINPGEDAGMGIVDGGFNYVAYDKYRNTGQNPNTFAGDPGLGNRLFDIASIRRVAEGRGDYIEFETVQNVYGASLTGGNSNFDDQGMKDWTEPIYIINIVRTGANVPDKDTQVYMQTTHYQKLESIIGKSTGLANQVFPLVDERWEDSISAPQSTYYGASTDRYIYIKLPSGEVQKWINITYKTAPQIAVIINGIVTNTNGLSGVYRHTNVENQNRFFEINFNHPSYIPPIDSLIIVKYDNTAPIRVYGGDTFIGETIFAPIDRQASAKKDEAENQFAFGLGLPYKDFKINPRHYTIRNAGAAVNAVQDEEWFTLGFLRQLCVMFTVESRACCPLAYNLDFPNQFFPLINYIIRPNRWDIDKNTIDNHIFPEYDTDYPGERDIWKWGGFRFLQQINPDYSTESRISFFSKPQFGFIEKREFKTRTMWSLPRAINHQNAPGLKTFPANNSFDIDDNQGEIKAAWSATSEKGENLYVFCNTGICMLITRKSILSDVSATEIGLMATDSFVKQQYWLNKEIGMFDEFWRGKAEGLASFPGQDGSESTAEAIYFPTKESVYRLMNNDLKDIGRADFHSKIYIDGLKNVGTGLTTPITAIFNTYYQEYWLHIKGEVDNTFVFGQRRNAWYGTNDFKFDKFTDNHYTVLGHRNFETYTLDEGYEVNGAPVEYEVLTAVAAEQNEAKEFIRIRINTFNSVKPTRVEFYKEKNGVVQCFLDPSQGPLYLKDYNGQEQFIGRILASVNPNRPRLQGRLVLFKILHTLASDFKLIDVALTYKKLK